MDILKLWTVVWTAEAMKDYGVETKTEQIISIPPEEKISVNISKFKMGRPKIRFTEPLAIFHERDEAKAFRNGNTDWIVVPCELEINLPS